MPSFFRRCCFPVFAFAACLGVPQVLSAQSRVVLEASAVESGISIDGRLDEAVWQQVEPASGFVQYEPHEGAPASQQTEVRVLYGPENVYVGVLLHDSEPEKIQDNLGRRDEINQADWFMVSIDSYFDQKTAYTFAVNAAGVQFDAIETGGDDDDPDEEGDASWDAVWDSAVRITPEGWEIEMRIPYSMLRFAKAESQTWGIHFRRMIPRLGENTEWPLIPSTERANLVARYGQLRGLRGIEPRRNIQIRPYTVTGLHTRENDQKPGERDRYGSFDVGGDLKVGVGSNIILDATVNPDFGQVETDPAVLNLTAFETFLEERRPFFVEGVQIYEFSAGPGQLLYTRRIGSDAPIIGAVKLSGRTARGFSFGVLGASTGHEFSPNRYYGISRLRQQIGSFSTAGGILTVFDASESGVNRRSFSGGVDWDLRFFGNRYGIEGFASVTHRTGRNFEQETGAAGKVWARKRQGAWTYFVGLDVFSDTFNPNDIGQLDQNNFIANLLSVNYQINAGQPFGPFQRASVDNFSIQQFAFRDGLNLGLEVSLDSRWTLRNFRSVELGTAVEKPFGGYDLYETRGLGPWAEPTEFQLRGEFETDERKNWQIEPEGGLTFSTDSSLEYEIGLRTSWNVGSRLSLEGSAMVSGENEETSWTSNESLWRSEAGWMIGERSVSPTNLNAEDYVPLEPVSPLDEILSGVTPFDPPAYYFVPVFGRRDTRSVDVTVRSSITFRPNLSLQVYAQLFAARGRYGQFQILRDRDTLVPFDAYPKRNEFAFSSLQTNAVLRWEYLPGSTLYLVWTHGRRAEDILNPLAPWGASPYETPVGEQFADTFGIIPDNIFLIKLNYTFLR